jgi:hypothetical protein
MRVAGHEAGNTLALEHALIMLLLLVGLLSIRSERRRYVPWLVLVGVGLSLFTPIHVLDPAWPLLSFLLLPPLLWQVAIRLAAAQPTLTWRGLLAWSLTALLVGLALAVAGRLPLAGALLLGMLAASLVWQVRERAAGSADLGAFGQLTLALLLAEVDVTLHPLGPFLGSLFTGTGLGLLLGYVGVRVAFRVPVGGARNLFCLGLAYLAYLMGAVIGASAVVTATMTALMVAVYGYNAGLWPTQATVPAPLNRRGVFYLLGGAYLLLGWQAHVPLTASHAAGIASALAAVVVGVLVGRLLAPQPQAATRPLPRALLAKEGSVYLLLLGTLLLWPPEAVVEARPLALALLAALVTVMLLRIALHPVFDLMGIELRPPDPSAARNGDAP